MKPGKRSVSSNSTIKAAKWIAEFFSNWPHYVPNCLTVGVINFGHALNSPFTEAVENTTLISI